LLPTVGAALVIGVGGGGGSLRFGVGRVLSLAPMRYIGDRSYAFYLWHWPVLVLAGLYVGHDLSVRQNLLLLLGAFGLSIVSYRFVENPIHRAEWSSGASLVLWPASCAAVVLLAAFAVNSLDEKAVTSEAAAAAVAQTRSASAAGRAARAATRQAVSASLAGHPLPAVVAAVRASERGERIPLGLNPPAGDLLAHGWYSWPAECGASDGQTTNAICHFGRTSSPKSIVLFGDSHAEMWMPAILSMAETDNWDVRSLSKSACTPERWNDARHWAECHAWYLWAVRQVKALHPDVVLISGCCGGYEQELAETVKNALLGLATSVKPFVKHVVIVGDNSGIAEQPLDCLLGRHATMRSCTTVWSDEHFYLNQDLAALTKRRRVGFVDTSGWFCFENHCPMVVGHTIVYIDTGHITDQYAETLAAPFRAAFRQAIHSPAPADPSSRTG
jgi:hypothetical protein